MNCEEIKKNPGIYKITNIFNGKMYIGSAVNCFRRLVREHFKNLRLNKHCNIHLQRSWNKYGKDCFKFEVIEYVETKEELIPREQYYLNKLLFADFFIEGNDKRFKKLGYNIAPIAGSCLGVKHSEETRRKASERQKGKYAGEKNPMYNKTHTEEARRNISEKNKGRKATDETRKQMSESRKGRATWNKGIPCTEKRKEKISENLKDRFSGKNSFNYKGGYKKIISKLENNAINNVSEYVNTIGKVPCKGTKSNKVVIQYDVNMLLIKEWPSIKTASDTLNIGRHSIVNCCKGNSRHAGFFIWKFKGTEELAYEYRSSPILQLDSNFNIINEFPQIIIAAEQLQINRKGIGEALKSKESYCGFFWIRKKDYKEILNIKLHPEIYD